jgi:signal transduction histidine kinase
VAICIDDDGPGIPIEDRSRVLERFIRLEDSRARDEGGAGLGLALVDAVASAHGGTVVVSESESGGARFEIRLPAAAS